MEKVKSQRHEKNKENYPFGGWGWEKKGNNPIVAHQTYISNSDKR